MRKRRAFLTRVTSVRAFVHAAKNTSAAINSETGETESRERRPAKEQNERRSSRFFGVLNKRKEKGLNKSKLVSPRSRELPGLRGYEPGNPRDPLRFPRGNPLAENLSCPSVGIGFPSFAPLCSYRALNAFAGCYLAIATTGNGRERRKAKRTSGRSHFYNVPGRLIDKWTNDTLQLFVLKRERERERAGFI